MADKKYYEPMLLEGTFRYPKLSDPDTKGEYADGKYKSDIIPTPENLAAYKARLEALAARWFPGRSDVKLPIKTDKDGNTFLYAKAGTHKKTKAPKQPIIVDARKQRIPTETVKIGGGSTGRFNVTASNYKDGINLYLEAVQVLKLVEQHDPLAGFGADEDGYDGADEHGFTDEGGEQQSSGVAHEL